MRHLTIGKRLFLAFTLALIFVVAVAATGQWALKRSADSATKVIEVDFAINTAANDLHIAVIDLRRYEKDFFINMGDSDKQASYLDKWKEAQQRLNTELAAIEALPMNAQTQADLRDIHAGAA